MAKNRVAVLEIYESPERSAPETHCGRGVADYLVAMQVARRIHKRLIQMICGKAALAITEAKRALDLVNGVPHPVYSDGRISSVTWRPRLSGLFNVMQAKVYRAA